MEMNVWIVTISGRSDTTYVMKPTWEMMLVISITVIHEHDGALVSYLVAYSAVCLKWREKWNSSQKHIGL